MSSSVTIAKTVVRVAVGGVLFAHGAQKLFGLFGGGGIDGTAGFFSSVGIKPARESAIAAGLGEAGGGVALMLGLATPVGAAAAAGTMTVAASQHTKNGFFNANGGFEHPLTLGLVAASFLIGGPGKLSLDHALGNVLNRPWMRIVAAAVGVPAAAYVIIRQRREQAMIEPTHEGPGDDE